MLDHSIYPSRYGLAAIGLTHRGRASWNLRPAALIAESLRRGESQLAETGALVAHTGARSGRSPKDKFIVQEGGSADAIAWGDVNRPFDAQRFDALQNKMYGYLRDRDLFVQDLYCGAHPEYRLSVRVITEQAWHALFARQLFVRPPMPATSDHEPKFTVICAPGFCADPDTDGTRSDAFILVNFAKNLVLIGGTLYAGEIKKSIFSVMNYLLPRRGILPMHCSANIGADGHVALFFGLSGTGKTTLSADPRRRLIGDDEHGWADDGVFNFEGGCYAKVINLSHEDEPQIHAAIRFGTVLENVVLDPRTHRCDYRDGSLTENTRAAYPLDFIDNAVEPAVGGHPRNIIFLTCDAFGVLPPISRLTADQAMYHFLSGYTAKIAGTEAGLGDEPQATFSTCFGEPFLPLRPSVYAELLGKKIEAHGARVWLVNTGWSGGPFGIGHRMRIRHTRAMVAAALRGDLDDVPCEPHPVFRVGVPQSCPEIPAEVLDPRQSWDDRAAYDDKARNLAERFTKNFRRFESVAASIRSAGPAA